ncbi:MAG: zeta toxin family protein [Pseudomonadota bacterium]
MDWDLQGEKMHIRAGKTKWTWITRVSQIRNATGKVCAGVIVQSPTVYVISGPNGAGKTTFANEFLPDFVHCREFLNADLIAAGLSPFAPETQNFRAGRLLLTRIKELTKAKQDFGFETTLSGRSYVSLLSKMQTDGYSIVLFFLWLPSADLAVARVRNRVQQGGHNVPESIVRRRFEAGIRNLFQLYRPWLNAWWIYDASRLPPEIVAQEEDGKLLVLDSPLFEKIRRNTET